MHLPQLVKIGFCSSLLLKTMKTMKQKGAMHSSGSWHPVKSDVLSIVYAVPASLERDQ